MGFILTIIIHHEHWAQCHILRSHYIFENFIFFGEFWVTLGKAHRVSFFWLFLLPSNVKTGHMFHHHLKKLNFIGCKEQYKYKRINRAWGHYIKLKLNIKKITQFQRFNSFFCLWVPKSNQCCWTCMELSFISPLNLLCLKQCYVTFCPHHINIYSW